MEELLSQIMQKFNLDRKAALEYFLNERRKPTRAREDYVKIYPGSKNDLANKIFDYLDYMNTPEFKSTPVLKRAAIRKELQKLIDESYRGFVDADDPNGFLRH